MFFESPIGYRTRGHIFIQSSAVFVSMISCFMTDMMDNFRVESPTVSLLFSVPVQAEKEKEKEKLPRDRVFGGSNQDRSSQVRITDDCRRYLEVQNLRTRYSGVSRFVNCEATGRCLIQPTNQRISICIYSCIFLILFFPLSFYRLIY